MSVDLTEIEPEAKRDFRRANGAPMVSDPDNPNKTARYSRPSGWGHDLDDESALVNWRIRTAMQGVAQSKALQAKIVAADGNRDAMKDLQDEATQLGRGNEGSDLGTALHAMSERYDRNEAWTAPEPFHSRLAQYREVLECAGLVAHDIEVHVVNDDLRAAGTADRTYVATQRIKLPDGTWLEAGEKVIGDLKTGAKLDYSLPGYVIQMAIYAYGQRYNIQEDLREGPLGVHPRWGLLVHLPAEGSTCELIWVPLEVGLEGAALVKGVRAWRKRTDFGAMYTFPAESQEEAVMGAVAETFPDTVTKGSDGDSWTPLNSQPDDSEWATMMTPWARERVQQIGRHEQARARLIKFWPEGLPPIKQGGYTNRQMTVLLDLLDGIEADHSLPFITGRPDNAPGLHASEINHSNQAKEST